MCPEQAALSAVTSSVVNVNSWQLLTAPYTPGLQASSKILTVAGIACAIFWHNGESVNALVISQCSYHFLL